MLKYGIIRLTMGDQRPKASGERDEKAELTHDPEIIPRACPKNRIRRQSRWVAAHRLRTSRERADAEAVIDGDFVARCDAGAFMVESNGQGRFRLSIRTLMIAVALCAVLLALAVWTVRQVEMRVRLERLMADQARAQAERATYLAQMESAQAALAAAKLGTTDQKKAGSLWAGLSVNHPIFRAGQTKDLRIEFTLVNDGNKVIEPKIPESHIVINSKELSDSGLILSSVQKGDRFGALPPGESLQFDCLLGDRFKEPAIYRVSWTGAGFQSSEIVLRILPEGAR